MRFVKLLIFLFIVSSGKIYSQKPGSVSEKDMAAFKKEAQQRANILKARLEKEEYLYDDEKEISIEFAVDTFMIEALNDKLLELDDTTPGMAGDLYRREEGYDQLLNKYYKRLLEKFSTEDQQVLKEAQRNWVTFRDSERKLFRTLADEKYSGGGTIQRLHVAGRTLNLTKARVIEIVNHIIWL